MKIFIDTANIEKIKEINSLGIISGVTTNPALIAKEGKDLIPTIREICGIVNGVVNAEVLATESGKMVEEALKLASISEKIVIKLPMTKDGIAASSILAGKGIKTNITCVYSANQSILAANAGAAYVSPFVARGDDFGIDGIKVLQDISTIYRLHGIKTKIIAASMRSPRFVMAAAMAGSDIATIPYEVINKMFDHPLTDSSLEGFMNDWKKVMGSKGIL